VEQCTILQSANQHCTHH